MIVNFVQRAGRKPLPHFNEANVNGQGYTFMFQMLCRPSILTRATSDWKVSAVPAQTFP